MVRAFCHEHGLSIALATLGLGGLATAWVLNPDLTLAQVIFDLSLGILTALLFVLLTKRFIERGSPQSKKEPGK